MAMRMSLAITVAGVMIKAKWKSELLIKNTEELQKPKSFIIDGPDPYTISEK